MVDVPSHANFVVKRFVITSQPLDSNNEWKFRLKMSEGRVALVVSASIHSQAHPGVIQFSVNQSSFDLAGVINARPNKNARDRVSLDRTVFVGPAGTFEMLLTQTENHVSANAAIQAGISYWIWKLGGTP